MSTLTCRSCGSPGVSPFYETLGVPVDTSVVLDSRDDALAIPTGDIVLGLCGECGFIANVAHPEKVRIPDADYEDQQGYSATFMAYATRLAQQLGARCDLRGKRVVEIGCGKGDFLELLCQQGEIEGVGIDPLFDKARMTPGIAKRVTAVSRVFDADYGSLDADLVVCRHTLEHIPDVGSFLGILRDALDDTPVVFEVPDVARILAEGAFWDVYYEHCSYFTAGSMARAFRVAGFDVVEVERVYGDQYLLLHARATDPASDRATLEEPVSDLIARAGSFAVQTREARESWRERLRGSCAIWGSGSKCVAFATTLGIAGDIECIVDINPHRHNRYLPGLGNPILAPEALMDARPDTVIAMNPIYRDEIAASVRGMGLNSEVVAV